MLSGPFTKSSHLYHSFISLLQSCKSMTELKRIHAQITTHGLSADNFLVSKLLLFSAISDSGDIDYSCQVFRTLPAPTTFIYNTLIRGFSKSKNPNFSISLYTQMLRAGVSTDHLTFPFLAKSCARLSSLPLGLPVHARIVKNGLELDLFVQNSLIHMYASCDDILSARRVFDEMSQPNVVHGMHWLMVMQSVGI